MLPQDKIARVTLQGAPSVARSTERPHPVAHVFAAGGWAIDVSHQIAALLERLPLAVALFDASGRHISKVGRLSDALGAVVPSRDPREAKRWSFTDRDGATIPSMNWPSARALRGEMLPSGLIGRYHNGGEHLIKVTCIPTHTKTGGVAAVSFLQCLDQPSRCTNGSHADLEQRFIETLIKAVSAA